MKGGEKNMPGRKLIRCRRCGMMVYVVTRPADPKLFRKYGQVCPECMSGEEQKDMNEELIHMNREARKQQVETALAMAELQ